MAGRVVSFKRTKKIWVFNFKANPLHENAETDKERKKVQSEIAERNCRTKERTKLQKGIIERRKDIAEKEKERRKERKKERRN